MTQQIINLGPVPNDGQGDNLRTAFDKTNENFDQIWTAGPVGSNVQIQGNTVSTLQVNQDLALSPNGTGNVRLNNNTIPGANNTWFLGSTTNRWRGLYVGEVTAANVTITNDLVVPGDVTIGGNLTVEGDTIQIGNIVTDTKTIQLANTAATSAAANGSGITVGANDNIATFLYNSTTNSWVTNLAVTYANGQPIGKLPGGSNTQIQFNDGGNFGGNANFTYNRSTGNFYLGGANLLAVVGNNQPYILQVPGLAFQGGSAIMEWDPTNQHVDVSNSFSIAGTLQLYGNYPGDGAVITTSGGSGVDITIEPSGNLYLNADGGEVIVSDQTPSINSNTGALKVLGGIGVNGNINAGGNITANYFVGNGSLLTGIQTGAVISNTAPALGTGGIWWNSVDGRAYVKYGNIFIDLSPSLVPDPTTYVGNVSFEDITITNVGNVIPAGNNAYSLGSEAFQWKDLWVSNNTIYINSAPISLTAGNVLTVNGAEVVTNVDGQTSVGNLDITGTYVSIAAGADETLITVSPNIEGQAYLQIPNDATANVADVRLHNDAGNIELGTGSGSYNWYFDNSGNLTAPGNIITPDNFVGSNLRTNLTDFNWSESISNIVTGATTVVTLANNVFGDPWSGQVTITDVTGTTEANGTWWYQAVDSNQFALYTDNTLSTPVDSTAWGAYTGGGFAVTLGYANIEINGQNVTIRTDHGDYNNRNWQFNVNGQTVFPYQDIVRGDTSGGNITGYAMVMGNGDSEAIISTPNGNATYSNSQRLVINPGKGADGTSGEGGDIYLWAGRGGDADGNGGDIKIRGGYAPGNGSPGYIRVEGGYTQGTQTGGFIELYAGDSNGGNGGYLDIRGGQGQINGGDANITGGLGQTGPGGAVNITGGVSGNGLAEYGNVNISAGASSWTFDNTGNLTIPSHIVVAGGIVGTGASPAPSLSGFSSVSAIDITASGNVSGNYILGNGAFLTGVATSYGNANVSNFLANGFGSNTITTTGNVTAGNIRTNNNLTFTANAGNIVFNNTAYISGNANALGRDGSIVLAPYTGAGSTFPGVVIGGAGRLIAPNGSVHQIFNANDVTFQVPVKGTSTAATSTTTGALQLTGGAGIGGNIYVGGIANVTGNINGSGATFSGNVTAQNFVGNISITGNVTGTSSNVTLVAGAYSAVFDNTGVLTLPTIGGSEGGEINFGIPAANTTLTGSVKLDVFQDRIRFFDGSTKGAYIDLSQAATGVNTLLNNRVSAFVDAGTFVTMDNIKATVTGSAPRGLSLATVSGTFSYNIGGTYGSSGVGSSGSSAGGQTLTTTPTGSIFGWGFTVSGDIAVYHLTDTTNNKCYRITVQIGASFLNNSIIIERLI